uniref:Calpain catalytic domain-containing protein n=1 Tax=Kwoniella dejecticola CBS 10117 TaxID=1296121 RepID=A0A1A6A2X4_9TREE|nr:uncharacterized protein I303_05264 [Kwoniella dejecticola CBS 10117]OBR84406.1 hypothetical protein I303_05264 [Kwoniella dejecticola CBS 10117]
MFYSIATLIPGIFVGVGVTPAVSVSAFPVRSTSTFAPPQIEAAKETETFAPVLKQKRGTHPLWEFQPKWQDIKADQFEDDWLLAGAAALAHVDPQKIQDIFSDVDNTNKAKRADADVDDTMVKLWNIEEWEKWNNSPAESKTGGPPSDKKKVKYSDITGEYSGANQNWWIAALENAFIQESGYEGITSSGFTSGDPHMALKMMTGEEALLFDTTEMPENTYKAEMWRELEKAERQPICIMTGGKADGISLWNKWWYAVLRVEGEESDGQVYLFDSWTGQEVSVKFQDLQEHIYWYVHQEGPRSDAKVGPP